MGKYFGTDGIRGVANDTLSLDIAYKVGRFLGYYVKNNGQGKIVIGKDTRLSSSMFENMIASGISASGASAYLMDYCSTPSLAYVAQYDGFDLGIMISASHNPYYDNGIKVFSNNGEKLKEDIEGLVEEYIDNPTGIKLAIRDDIGSIYHYEEGLKHYKKWIKELYSEDLSSFKILIDCANGSNSYIAYEVLKDLKANVEAINDSPNGKNINNGCGSTHLESLVDAMKKGNYDIGFAFDGDADRVLVVDKDGKPCNGDEIMYVLAKYLKDINKLNGSTLVVTGYSNVGLHKALEKLGIKTDVVDNGDKYVLESLIKNNYSLGGEQSGHIINMNDCRFGDGLKSALCLLTALKYYGKSFTEAKKDLIIYPQLLVNLTVKDKKAVLEDREVSNKIATIKDSLKDNGQILVRASGTEPLIRVMVEAESDELCKKYVNEVADLIKIKNTMTN